MYENLLTFYGKLFDFDETIKILIEKLKSNNISYRSTGDFIKVLGWDEKIEEIICSIDKVYDHFVKLQKKIKALLTNKEEEFYSKARNVFNLNDDEIEKLKNTGICRSEDSLYYVEIINDKEFNIKLMQKKFTAIHI